MKIVVLNGFPRSGKDEFFKCCQRELGKYCKLISTVDFVKEIAFHCGWNGEKTAKNRKFLSDLKDLLTGWGDIPFQKTIQEIKLFEFDLNYYDVLDKGIVFIMCREPKEIEKFKKLGAKSILIRRPAVEFEQQSNHADKEVLNYKYDYIIENDGTLKDLQKKAKEFLKNL